MLGILSIVTAVFVTVSLFLQFTELGLQIQHSLMGLWTHTTSQPKQHSRKSKSKAQQDRKLKKKKPVPQQQHQNKKINEALAVSKPKLNEGILQKVATSGEASPRVTTPRQPQQQRSEESTLSAMKQNIEFPKKKIPKKQQVSVIKHVAQQEKQLIEARKIISEEEQSFSPPQQQAITPTSNNINTPTTPQQQTQQKHEEVSKKQIDDLKQELKNKTRELQDARNQLNQLAKDLESANRKYQKAQQQHTKQIEDLARLHGESQSQKVSHQEVIETMERKIQKLKLDLDHKNEIVRQEKQRALTLEQQLTQEKDVVQSHLKSIEHYQNNKHEHFAEALEKHSRIVSELTAAKDQLTLDVQYREVEISQLRMEIQTLEAENASLQLSSEEAQKQLEETRKSLSESDSQVKNLTSLVSNLEHQLAEKDQTSSTTDGLTETIEKLSSENEELRNQLSSLESVEAENSKLNELLADKKREIEEYERVTSELQDFKHQRDQLVKDNKQYQEQIELLKQESDKKHYEDRIATLLTDIERLKEELKLAHESAKSELEKEIENTREQISKENERAIEKLSDEVAQLQTSLEDAQQAVVDQQVLRDKALEEMNKIKKEREELEKALSTATAQEKASSILYFNGFDGQFDDVFMNQITSPQTVETIILEHPRGEHVLKQLGHVIEKEFPNMTTFAVRGAAINEDSLSCVMKPLFREPKLVSLELSNIPRLNDVADRLNHIFIQAIKNKNMAISSLILTRSFLGSNGGNSLLRALNNYSLDNLMLGACEIGQDSVSPLRSIRVTKSLDIHANNLEEKDIISILNQSKIAFNTLEVLNMADNKLGSEGARALADRLKEMGALKSLNISHTGIPRDEIATIIKAILSKCKQLEILELEQNDMTDSDVDILISLVNSIPSLQVVKLANNRFSKDGLSRVNKAAPNVEIEGTPQMPSKEEEEKKHKEEQEELERQKQHAQAMEDARIALEEKKQAEHLQKEMIENERLNAERMQKEEAERLEREKREQEESDRIKREQEEAERLENERIEQERLQREEEEQISREKEERERIEREREEAERIQREREEQEQIQKEQEEQERIRIEKEREEAERLQREQEEERLKREKEAEDNRLRQEKEEREKLEQETLERERLEREEQEHAQRDQEALEAEHLNQDVEGGKLSEDVEQVEHEKVENSEVNDNTEQEDTNLATDNAHTIEQEDQNDTSQNDAAETNQEGEQHQDAVDDSEEREKKFDQLVAELDLKPALRKNRELLAIFEDENKVTVIKHGKEDEDIGSCNLYIFTDMVMYVPVDEAMKKSKLDYLHLIKDRDAKGAKITNVQLVLVSDHSFALSTTYTTSKTTGKGKKAKASTKDDIQSITITCPSDQVRQQIQSLTQQQIQ